MLKKNKLHRIGHFGDLTFHYNSQTRENDKKIIPIKKKIATIGNLLFCVYEAKKRLFCFKKHNFHIVKA